MIIVSSVCGQAERFDSREPYWIEETTEAEADEHVAGRWGLPPSVMVPKKAWLGREGTRTDEYTGTYIALTPDLLEDLRSWKNRFYGENP